MTAEASRLPRVTRGMQWYGWDSRTETWYGPNELKLATSANGRLLQALRAAPGKSWYGPLNCNAPDAPSCRFFAMAHDLLDCAVALIYCDESKAGPAEVLAVIPPHRRARLRSDFPFEFLAFARFLNSLDSAAELRVHDAIAAGIAESGASDTLVFSINSGLWPSDLDPVLSQCAEKVAAAMAQWVSDGE